MKQLELNSYVLTKNLLICGNNMGGKGVQKRWNKLCAIDTCFCIAALLVLVIGLILPKTGIFVLVDEIFAILIWWIAGIYVVCKIVAIRKLGTKTQKIARGVVAIGCIVICLWLGRNVVVDFVSGTEEISLYDIEVSRYQGFAGILASHYYMTGEDAEGNIFRFEISPEDYERYMYGGAVRAVYYKNTGRVVEFK